MTGCGARPADKGAPVSESLSEPCRGRKAPRHRLSEIHRSEAILSTVETLVIGMEPSDKVLTNKGALGAPDHSAGEKSVSR